VWVLKLDAAGEVVWQKTYGGPGDDGAHAVRQMADGGYLVSGWESSFGAGGPDGWLLKLDAAGGVEWQKAYGGPGKEWVYGLEPPGPDGVGYLLAGSTTSAGAGGTDLWLARVAADGSPVWQNAYGGPGLDGAVALVPAGATGYFVGGTTERSFNSRDSDFWI